MNYKESRQILEEIKKAKKILVNCHKSPDADSFGAALAMYGVLENMGKELRIICPTKFETNFTFLEDFNKIEVVDFKNFNFSGYDLFLVLDSSSYDRVTGDKEIRMPEIPFVIFDHHQTNEWQGTLNIEEETTSTAEILYRVFQDWGVEIDKKIATALLTGIIGDTGAFQYPGCGAETFRVVEKLIEKGASKDEIVGGMYRKVSFNIVKFWGEVLSEMEIDEKAKFVWTAIPYEKFIELGSPLDGKDSAAALFAPIVDGTDFGLIMVEVEKGTLSVSLRSRTGFDTSIIAKELGGGGHVYASGGRVIDLPFNEAVEKVLSVVREHARKS
jgi:phosphoesterase RecJ-like protein